MLTSILQFTISELIYFIFGIFAGMLLLSMSFIYLSFRGKNVDVTDIKRPQVDGDEDELKLLILNRQNKFKRRLKHTTKSVPQLTFDMSYELVEEISRYFFPESKYPMLELSITEIINLNKYVSNRVDEILDKPILKNSKNFQVITFIKMYEKKKQFDESRAVRAAKKYHLGKVVKYGSMALNAVNPVYWFRKLVINTSLDMMTKKISTIIIGIVGEETTKIYSKKLFDKQMNLDVVDQEVDEFLEEAEKGEIDETD
ncbi:MAG: hypothetical protein K9L74_03420 [Candidatus Izimaplasma sp.]|nr:hypothetical protein [Candidatus Izimaplasma bacterium]